MKRFICLAIASVILILSLAGCGEPGSAGSVGNKGKIGDELTGVWYGPDNDPVLNIQSNGTGTVNYKNTEYEASFTAENGMFSASSSGFLLSGEYALENDQLFITADYESTEYTVVFTRAQTVIPEDIKGSHAYSIGDKAYEIVVDETIICKGIPFPPSEDYPEQVIYFVPDKGSEDSTTEGNAPDNNTDFRIFPKPPEDIYKPETTNNTNNTNNTENNTSKTENSTNNTEAETKEQSPSETKPQNKDNGYIPEKISKKGEDISVTVYNEEVTTIKNNGSIVGTWTSDKQDGTAYILGYQGDISYTITFTFNADGTGTVTALFFPGTMTWSLNGHRLDMTISMLGDTESGTAYVSIAGDVMYLLNLKGELHTLTRVG